MPGKGHSPEQVLNKLRQVEVAVAGGKSVGRHYMGSASPTTLATGGGRSTTRSDRTDHSDTGHQCLRRSCPSFSWLQIRDNKW